MRDFLERRREEANRRKQRKGHPAPHPGPEPTAKSGRPAHGATLAHPTSPEHPARAGHPGRSEHPARPEHHGHSEHPAHPEHPSGRPAEPSGSGHTHAHRQPATDADAVALSTLAVGETGEIVRVISKSRSRVARLGAYGVVPGSHVQLLQKIPAFVIRLDETELGLDVEVARDILVRRHASGRHGGSPHRPRG